MINTKEQTVINSIKDAFEGENTQSQYTVLGYRIVLYFHKFKLAIEVDELGHNDRSADHETQRERALEREFNCVFIRINRNAADFNICREINKIHGHINQSSIQQTEQKTKNSLTDNLLRELLELEFKQHDQLLTKFFKWIVKNILPNYKSKKMHIYCKKCKKHTINTFPKKLVSISKNKSKENQDVLFV